MKWSRERAIGYFRRVLGEKESIAITEVERDCIIPGQACSHMVGKLEFLAGRERARKAQGVSFDIRKYHDSVLLPGALPLDMLRRI